MGMGTWVVARDVAGRPLALFTEKHCDDLPAGAVLVDEELGDALGLASVGETWTRVVHGRPFRRAAAPGGTPSALVTRLADATRVDLDSAGAAEIDPSAVRPPAASLAQALRAKLDAAWSEVVARARQGSSTAEPTVPTEPTDRPAPSPEDLRTQADLLAAPEPLALRLTARDLHVLTRRYGLEDGVVRPIAEVAVELGMSAERVRQIDRAAVIRLRETGAL